MLIGLKEKIDATIAYICVLVELEPRVSLALSHAQLIRNVLPQPLAAHPDIQAIPFGVTERCTRF